MLVVYSSYTQLIRIPSLSSSTISGKNQATLLCQPQSHILFMLISTSLQEKAMATYSSTLAWKIPWMEEPGRLQSMGSLRVGHDRETSLSLFTFMHWRRKWQPTPAFLPGESQGRGSLVGCRLQGCTESDTTEVTQQQLLLFIISVSGPYTQGIPWQLSW